MNHTMQRNSDGTYTVGVYGARGPGGGPGGPALWHPLAVFPTFAEAAAWVHFLNGGPNKPS